MTVIGRVVDALGRQPGGVPVGDLARQLGLSYQGVRNEIERSGRHHGVLIDRACSPAVARLAVDRRAADDPLPAWPAQGRNAQPTEPDDSREPDWEGNVQARLCRWLVDRGWILEQALDTASRERGTDVVARRDDRRIHVEVKGWPSVLYADSARRDEAKRTNPTNQALHWFAGATHSCLRLRDAHPTDRVAMAFPDRARYRTLATGVSASLSSLKIEVWFVGADTVETSDDAA